MSDVTSQLSTALAGRYQIEKHVGEGGMATVYLAHDLKHERKVALKVLRPELAAVIGAERFLNEIRVTANLQHPHILPLHDSGDAEGFLYYVMPFVEEETLRDKLDREKQFSIEEALAITQAIASALDYAHRQGVIHRDIKPANILLHDGQPMIADFGIALAVSEASERRLTETGLSIGTPHYMSPEQAMGDRQLDARSDVYSLGAMLYEMLTGEPPHGGNTAQAVVARVITAKATPARDMRETVPPHVDAAVSKSLQRMPADRFASAAAFAEALSNPGFTVASTVAAPVAMEGAPARARRSWITPAVASLAAAAAFFWVGRTTAPEPPSRVARFRVAAPEEVANVSVCCGPAQALSPDGEWLVYVAVGAEDGANPLLRRRIDQLEAEVIPGTAGASIPFFSPDSRWLGFHANGRLQRVPMTGGPPVPIADVPRVDGASWGDNEVIVFRGADELATVPASGGAPLAVPNTAGMSYIHPWMLPGGEFALTRMAGSGPNADHQVVVLDLTTGEPDTLGFATRITFASGHLVMSTADGTLMVQPFDPGAREVTGPAVAIFDGVTTAGPGIGEFAVSNEGGIAYQAGDGGSMESLIVLGPNGPAEVPLPESGNLEHVTFSPDGRRIALSVTTANSRSDIWIYDRDQGTQARFTVRADANGAPVWSPDGSRIAFSSFGEDGEVGVYLRASDGSGDAELLLQRPDSFTMPQSWSPDGEALAVVVTNGDHRDLFLVTVGDTVLRPLVTSDFDEVQPQISPDGLWLAYTSNRSGQNEVYVEALDGLGGRVPISTDGGHSPRWAPDGSAIYYAQTGGRIVEAVVSTEGGFRVSSRAEAFAGVDDVNPSGAVNWDVSRDGEEFVYIDEGAGIGGRIEFVWVLNWPRILDEMGVGR